MDIKTKWRLAMLACSTSWVALMVAVIIGGPAIALMLVYAGCSAWSLKVLQILEKG